MNMQLEMLRETPVVVQGISFNLYTDSFRTKLDRLQI